MARPRTKTAHPISFRIDEEMFSLLEKFHNIGESFKANNSYENVTTINIGGIDTYEE